MSLNEINRELEDLLQQVRRMKREEELGAAIVRLQELREAAQDPDNEEIKVNKTQDVRTFENFTATYKEVKLRADSLRDSGRMTHAVNDSLSIETLVMEDYAVYRSHIEPRKLAMLEEFKDRYTEEELARVKEEDAKSYASKIEQNEREVNEANHFLQEISKDEIARYVLNTNILKAIEQLNKARAKFEAAQNKLATLSSPADDAEITVQQGIIAAEGANIDNAKALLESYNIVEAGEITDADGNVNYSIIDEINTTYKAAAMQEKKQAGATIIQNLERYVNNHSDSIQSLRRIEMYVGKIPTDFENVSAKELTRIVANLQGVLKNIDRKSTENHKFMAKIDEINKFLEKQQKEKDTIAGKGKTGADGTSRYGFKTPAQYRAEGVTLDDTYALKGFWERKAARQEYILQTLPKNAPFRRIRAWFRSFSPRAGYALSAAKLERETQYRRKEEAFQTALKQKGMSTESARVVGMKNVRTDKLSGNRKAQMEERE